ncbi:MAG: S8 family serine peptidase [Opitutaceae bacterium]|nr:S8 family serine peptidase [Opitutaceae bacterium]
MIRLLLGLAAAVLTSAQIFAEPDSRPALLRRVDVQIGSRLDSSPGAPGMAIPPAPGVVTTAMPAADAPSRVIVKLRRPDARVWSAVSTASIAPTAAGVDPEFAALLARHGVRSASPLVIAHLRDDAARSLSPVDRAARIHQRFPARAARAPAGATVPELSGIYILDLGSRSPSGMRTTLEALRADPRVLYAEEDSVVRTCYVPNDPHYSQHGSWGQPYDDLHGLKAISAEAAWDTTQGQGIVVAVVDTGVDHEHPDMRDNIWHNAREIASNGLDDDTNGFVDDVIGWDFVGQFAGQPTEDADPMDSFGHGTHVAGTIAATGDNQLGIVGVAWKAKVMAIKGLDDSGSGPASQLARCIVYAVDNGADIINASWGAESPSETIADAVNYARAHGVVFVAAAGNARADASGFYPANLPASITVAAVDVHGNAASFSNFGSRIDVAAPGVDILSLEPSTGGYVPKSGTSMAAPHVSGLAALILQTHPTFTAEQVRQALRVSATDLGVPGRDSDFGYGRIHAAEAVLLPGDVLGVRILTPVGDSAISEPTAVTGTAAGPGFARYTLEFGAGSSPTNWTTLRDSTAAVEAGELGTFDPSTLADGRYTIRLRATNTAGTTFVDQVEITVRYLEITSPRPPAVPSLTMPMKPGATYAITGSARGPSFQDYVIEWAPGVDATSGWSTEGVTLTGGGRSPVVDGTLGTWTLPANLTGFHSIRLRVNNNGFTSETRSSVYAEPALTSGNWPVLLPGAPYNEAPTVVTRADGTARFLSADMWLNRTMYSISYDGAAETHALGVGSRFAAPSADLDGVPGDEIVIPTGFLLEIVSSELDKIRTIIAPRGRYLREDPATLADLDHDGTLEILVPSRHSNGAWNESGALHVYGADGVLRFEIDAPFSPSGPLTFAKALAADLDGDGRAEIIVAFGGTTQSSYTVTCYTKDGTPFPGWTTREISGAFLASVSAADLDRDGASEIILVEAVMAESVDQVVVLDSTGAVRDGWPVRTGDSSGAQMTLSIGDLDQDGLKELVVVTQKKISIFNHDGTAWTPPWSPGGNPPFNSNTTPLIADVDGDGRQEILVVTTSVDFTDSSAPYHYSVLTIYDRTGAVLRSWPLFGTDGQQPVWGVPTVGDFNGDGLTDIAVTMSLIEGGGISGWLTDSSMVCLTTDYRFNAAGSDWVGNHGDPQNSRMPRTAAAFIARPADQSVSAGAPVRLTATVGGHPYPRIQWQKDGVDIPGATHPTLTFGSVQAWDAGHYTVVLTTASGSITSEATLTVDDVTAADSRVLNLSTRAFVRGMDQPLIPGFVVAGSGTKQLLIRAIGPRLRDLGVAGPIDDPRIILKRFDPGTQAYHDIAANDDWPDDAILKATSRTVGAFSLVPGSRDAAMLVNIAPGQYTVFAEAASGAAAGIALVEIYDADPAVVPASLTNVSNRGYVGVGAEIMIPGFVVANDGPKKFLFRAVGPGLARFGVNAPLADPHLTLYRAIPGTADSEAILTNDNWSEHPNAATTAATAAAVSAFRLEAGSNDAAFVATLTPGIYTIHARGVADATGEALVELYVVP